MTTLGMFENSYLLYHVHLVLNYGAEGNKPFSHSFTRPPRMELERDLLLAQIMLLLLPAKC